MSSSLVINVTKILQTKQLGVESWNSEKKLEKNIKEVKKGMIIIIIGRNGIGTI